jgi:hypothetical protein
MLGTARRVMINKNDTTIVEGAATEVEMRDRRIESTTRCMPRARSSKRASCLA